MIKNTQRGNALIIVVIVLVIIAVGAVSAYVFITKSSKNGKSIFGFTSMTASSGAEIKQMFANAKSGDYDVECGYTDDSGKPAKIYLSGADKLRVDTTIAKKPGHLLRLGDSAYIWADGQTEGTKLPFKDSGTNGTTAYEDNASKYKLTCHSVEHVDASHFNMPANVNFVEPKTSYSYSSSGSN